MAKKDLTSLFIATSLLLISFDYFGWLAPFKKTAEVVIVPMKRSVYRTSVVLKSLGSVVIQYPDIEKAFEDKLRLEKEQMESKVLIGKLTDENIKLRQQLESPLPASFKFIPAEVLGISRFLEIGAGEREGVKTGMPVVDGMTLLGKITTVSYLRSSVALLTDSDIKIAAKTSRGSIGTVIGQLGQNAILDKVLQKDPLFIDDQVVTSGLDNLPPDLLIGKISYIKSEDVEVYKQAQIALPVDISKEKTVFIISSL